MRWNVLKTYSLVLSLFFINLSAMAQSKKIMGGFDLSKTPHLSEKAALGDFATGTYTIHLDTIKDCWLCFPTLEIISVEVCFDAVGAWCEFLYPEGKNFSVYEDHPTTFTSVLENKTKLILEVWQDSKIDASSIDCRPNHVPDRYYYLNARMKTASGFAGKTTTIETHHGK